MSVSFAGDSSTAGFGYSHWSPRLSASTVPHDTHAHATHDVAFLASTRLCSEEVDPGPTLEEAAGGKFAM